jgi:hypothetical protein
MNCQEFQAAWNEILDVETPALRALSDPLDQATARLLKRELAADQHAAECANCRSSHEHYQRLRRALRACDVGGVDLIGPSPALAERVLAGARRLPRRSRARAGIAPLLAGLAASILLLWLSPYWPRLRLDRRPAEPAGAKSAVDPKIAASQPGRRESSSLSVAMADATAATWDLARTTSEPAARFGRQILEVATLPDDRDEGNRTSPDPSAASESTPTLLPSVLRVVTPSRSGSDLFQEVGEELSAGVRPFSSRAREAFGFLRTPALERTGEPNHQPPAKGT